MKLNFIYTFARGALLQLVSFESIIIIYIYLRWNVSAENRIKISDLSALDRKKNEMDTSAVWMW